MFKLFFRNLRKHSIKYLIFCILVLSFVPIAKVIFTDHSYIQQKKPMTTIVCKYFLFFVCQVVSVAEHVLVSECMDTTLHTLSLHSILLGNIQDPLDHFLSFYSEYFKENVPQDLNGLGVVS
jgi:hypothetical protein